MNLETEIYQILRKHRLSLKKREELIVDLLDFINKREKPLIIDGVSKSVCFNCGKTFGINHEPEGSCNNCGH